MSNNRFEPVNFRQNSSQIEIDRQEALFQEIITGLASNQDGTENLLATVEELHSLSQMLAEHLDEAETEQADYRALFGQSPFGYLITDHQGRIVEWNEAAEKLLLPLTGAGRGPDPGVPLYGRLLVDFIAVDERESFSTCLKSQMAEDECEWEVQASSESFRTNGPAGVQIRLTRLPVQDGSRHYFWTVSDETVRKYQEQLLAQLEAERARLSIIIANMPGAIIVTDRDSRVVLSNPAADRLYARPVTNFKNLDRSLDWAIYHPDGTPFSPEDMPIRRSAEHGETQINLEVMLVWPDGQQRSLLVNSAPILDRKGQVRGAVALLQDITQRKQAEAAVDEYMRRLERSNRALQDFASIASHDLQEPLRKVQAFGDRLRERLEGKMDPESLDYLDRMQNAAERMSVMISDLLAYSRVTTKAEPYTLVDLNEVVDDAKAMLELVIVDTGGTIKVGKLPVIEAEPIQMRQLIQNLVSNALKFHRPGVRPVLNIYLAPDQPDSSTDHPGQNQIVIVFEDNGIGFEPQYSEQIFQPFRRLHGLNQFEGNGMGLAICRKIVERHGGSISASGVPGLGATFRVTLPVKMSLLFQ